MLLFSLNPYSFMFSGNCCRCCCCYVTSLSAQTPHCKKSNAVFPLRFMQIPTRVLSATVLQRVKSFFMWVNLHKRYRVKSLKKRRIASKIYGLLLHVVSHDWWARAVCSSVGVCHTRSRLLVLSSCSSQE